MSEALHTHHQVDSIFLPLTPNLKVVYDVTQDKLSEDFTSSISLS